MDRNMFDAFAQFDYTPGMGYFGREPLPIMAGVWDDNGTLKALAIGGAGTVGFKYLAGDTGLTDDIVGLVWGATADSADSWVYPWTVPQDYKRSSLTAGSKSAIIARARVRKLDLGGATDNSDLEFQCMASWHSPALSAGVEADGDAAFNVLSAVVKGKTYAGATVVPAMAVAASEQAFRYMYWDIGAAMTDAQLAALKPGACMTIKLFPHEAVGTSQNLEVCDVEVLYTRHLVPEDKMLRQAVNHA